MNPRYVVFFQPGIRLLNRLHYPYKFILISAVFALPLAISLYMGIQDINSRIEFTEKELAGTLYVTGVQKAVADLQTYRGLTEGWLSGGTLFHEQTDTLRSALQADFQQLTELDRQFGSQLDTTPLWNEFRHSWQQFQEEQSNLSRQDIFDRHTILIELLLELNVHVGDRSNLILDPNLDTHYLMETVSRHLPRWTEALGQLRGLGAGILARENLSEQERTQLNYYKHIVETTQRTAIRAFAVVFKENPAFHAALHLRFQDSLQASDKVLETVDALILAGKPSQLEMANYWTSVTPALHTILTLGSDITPLLEQAMNARLSTIRNRHVMLVGVTLTALFWVFYMFGAFYISMLSRVSRMREVSDRLLLGEVEETNLPREGNDEMTEAVEVFRVVAGIVKTKWQAAEAEAIRALQAERRLQESEGRLRAIMDGAADGFVTITTQGIVKTFNDAASRIFGHEPGEMIGRHISDIISFSPNFTYERSLEKSVPMSEPGLPMQRQEVEGIRKDGEFFPLEIHLSPVRWTDRQLFTAIFRDLTDQKMAERRTNVHLAVTQVLAKSPALDEAVSMLLQAIGDGLLWQMGALWEEDEEGTHLRCVEVWQHKDATFTEFEAVTRTTRFSCGIGLPGRVWASKEAAWVTDVVRDDNFPRKAIAEKESLHGALAFPLRLQDNRVGVMEFFNDRPLEPDFSMLVMFQSLSSQISEFIQKKRAEAVILETSRELEQRNVELIKARDQALGAAQAKSQFLAVMSHEIRTPLNGILGLTELLLSSNASSEHREMLTTILACGRSLLKLLNDILDFSKMNAGKLELENLPFDLRSLIEEVLDLFSSRTTGNQVELMGLIEVNVPTGLQGDPGRFRQILSNLVGNAVKFTSEGEITLHVTVPVMDQAQALIRVDIRDTGIGIQHDAREQLFNPFQQSDSSMARKFGGTGLGLAICNQLVQLMEGEIGAESTSGEGSCFWVTLPFQLQPTGSVSSLVPSLQGMRVCVVDNNSTHLNILTHYLKSWGMICLIATSGTETLRILAQACQEDALPNVVILDHSLPDEDGWSLGRAIKNRSETAHLPLILLTAPGESGHTRETDTALFNVSVRKPVQYHHLHEAVLGALGKTKNPDLPDVICDETVKCGTMPRSNTHSDRGRILLAEDNPTNQQIALRMLASLGFDTDVVDNGRKAIQAFRDQRYDLVLMDCQMPEMDGLSATDFIRAHLDPERRTPIVALTANALSGDRERCLESGMDDFLSKPVSQQQLETLVQRWIPDYKDQTRQTSEGLSPYLENPSRDYLPVSASSKQPSQSPLDSKIILELRNLGGEDDPDFFSAIVDQFLDDLSRHLQTIHSAFDQENQDAFVRAVHACKGSCRSIGAECLAEVCEELERSGRERNMETVPEIWPRWVTELNRTKKALQDERDSHKRSECLKPS